MPSYYQHLVSPYDNREVKLNLSDETDNTQQNMESSTENIQNIQGSTELYSEEKKSEDCNTTNNSFSFNRSYSPSYNNNSFNINNNNMMDSNMPINYSSSYQNSLIPLENKSIYNVVENTNSNILNNTSIDIPISNNNIIYNEDLYELHNRLKTNKSEEDDKEVVKMPAMDFPPTPSNNQQLQSQKLSTESITLPSVT